MQKILLVIDMQNDFIDGSLETKEAVEIVPKVDEKIKNFNGTVIFTRDTHKRNYLETQEGKNLPVEHCIEGTKGWEICPALQKYVKDEPINKPTFGSTELSSLLLKLQCEDAIESIELIGLCTDICVISNAMICKATLPEVPVLVDASCCAGVSVKSHLNALEAMKMCQIKIINE